MKPVAQLVRKEAEFYLLNRLAYHLADDGAFEH